MQDAPPIGSAQFWRQPFRVAASSDPDEATAQTVAIMCDLVHSTANTPAVRAAAKRAVEQFGRLAAMWAGPDGVIPGAVFQWLKHYAKFVHHELLIRRFIGEAGHLQGLISPEVFVQMSRPEGDCAIYTMCACAFLEVFRIPWEIVTVKVSRREPREYSHVYLYVVMPDGSRMPLDASHGDYPGWQVPSRDIMWNENVTLSPALQVWDSSGARVADRGSRFTGLHNYHMRGGMAALVCDQDGVNCYDDGTVSPGANPITYPVGVTPCTCVNGTCLEDGNSCSSPGYVTPSGAPYSGPVFTAPSQNSAQWAAFATNALKSGLTLAEINSIQPGTVVSANGAILRQATGLPVPVGSSLNTSLSTLGSSPILLLGGLAVAVVLVMSLGGRR